MFVSFLRLLYFACGILSIELYDAINRSSSHLIINVLYEDRTINYFKFVNSILFFLGISEDGMYTYWSWLSGSTVLLCLGDSTPWGLRIKQDILFSKDQIAMGLWLFKHEIPTHLAIPIHLSFPDSSGTDYEINKWETAD